MENRCNNDNCESVRIELSCPPYATGKSNANVEALSGDLCMR